MSSYSWLTLVAAGLIFAVGATMWIHSGTAMVRVVSPSAKWLTRESRLNEWGVHLMTIAALLAVLGIAFGGGW